MGDSDKPLMRYSSSGMAHDVLEVLEHVGWVSMTSPAVRNIHVVGISMGGSKYRPKTKHHIRVVISNACPAAIAIAIGTCNAVISGDIVPEHSRICRISALTDYRASQ